MMAWGIVFGLAWAAAATPGMSPRESAVRLADAYARAHPAEKLDWEWKDGVFLFGLDRLRASLPPGPARERYTDFLKAYHRHWDEEGAPRIDRSDRCPSALTALSLALDEGDWSGIANAADVADYVRFHRRNSLGALDHLGDSWLRLVYPQSIWVDSLMMYAVFAARWASFTGDRELLEFAARQPGIFAAKLEDTRTGLFRHAWLLPLGAAMPAERAFWLRGNGWVMVSIVEILETLEALPAGELERERAEMIAILNRVAEGLEPFTLADGSWDSVANLPGFTYSETSGTSLVAYAMARGARRGWLPARFSGVAERAWRAVASRLVERPDGGLSMTGISGSTNAFPKFAYKLVPAKSDLAFGVGAYLLLASELLDMSGYGTGTAITAHAARDLAHAEPLYRRSEAGRSVRSGPHSRAPGASPRVNTP